MAITIAFGLDAVGTPNGSACEPPPQCVMLDNVVRALVRIVWLVSSQRPQL